MIRDKQSIDKEEEERIRRRQAGTAVTIESFMAWKAAFDEEQRLAALQNGKVILTTLLTNLQHSLSYLLL